MELWDEDLEVLIDAMELLLQEADDVEKALLHDKSVTKLEDFQRIMNDHHRCREAWARIKHLAEEERVRRDSGARPV